MLDATLDGETAAKEGRKVRKEVKEGRKMKEDERGEGRKVRKEGR